MTSLRTSVSQTCRSTRSTSFIPTFPFSRLLTRFFRSHFDRERIPERVVHAKGSGAHGTFEVIFATFVMIYFIDDFDRLPTIFRTSASLSYSPRWETRSPPLPDSPPSEERLVQPIPLETPEDSPSSSERLKEIGIMFTTTPPSCTF